LPRVCVDRVLLGALIKAANLCPMCPDLHGLHPRTPDAGLP
jgi:hypothetical protein